MDSGTHHHLTPSQKQKSYRNRLLRQGLRPVQIWVPNISAPHFVEECHRQALLVSQSAEESDVQQFIEDAADWGDE